MTYNTLRHLADSWGLVAMTVIFLVCVGWTVLPGARRAQHRAANSIFEDDRDGR